MRRSRALIPAGMLSRALVLVAVGVAAGCHRAALPPNGAAPSAAPPVPIGFAPAAWHAAERRSYRLTFRSVLTPQGSTEQITLGWSGSLALTALSVEDGRSDLAAEFTGTAQTNQDQKAVAQLNEGLKEPFFPVLAPDGRVTQVGLTSKTPTTVASAWKALLADLQFVTPNALTTSWSVEEDDPAGSYQASYAPAGEAGAWRKTKSTYLTLHAQAGIAGGQTTYTIEKAEGIFRFDPSAHLTGVEASERILTRSEPPIPSFLAETHLGLQLESSGTAPPGALAALTASRAQARFGALASGPDAKMRRDELDRGALANVSPPQLLASLDSGAPADQAARELRAKVRRLLGALLRQQPAHTIDIERRARLPRPDRGEMFEILCDAGTPEAQAALVRLSGLPSLNAHDRGSAAQSLGTVQRPTAETIAYFERLVDSPDMGAQAKLSLGSTVARLRISDPALGARTLAFLLDRLSHASTPGQTVAYLKALGNSGDPGALDALDRRIQGPAGDLRSTAIWSLRSIVAPPAGPRAEDILAGLAASAEEGDRVVAVRTLAFRPLTARSEATLVARLRTDPSPLVRQEVLTAGQRSLRQSQTLRDAFAACQQNDASPTLRESAARALSNLR
jgi:hypothetical protein